jgi:serine protease Do
MDNALVSFSNGLADIVRSVDAQVVSVRARRHYPAAGIRWSNDVVVTCDHAIQDEDDIAVTPANGKTVSARLVGRDRRTDLAVLKIESPGTSSGPLGRASDVKPGELALVVGRSPDSGVNASLGIVSAVSGAWRTWRGGQLDAYIRLDAKLFPQSSGGAVVNSRGELIGIATSALSRIAGIAIPMSTVQSVTEKLLQRGFVPRAFLGVGTQTVPLSEELRSKLSIPNRTGLIVLMVEPGGPAEKSGVLIGDVLTSIGGKSIEDSDDLQACLDSGLIGKPVEIGYVRGGAPGHLTLTVGERPGKRG